jgi:glycine betaine catabolism B
MKELLVSFKEQVPRTPQIASFRFISPEPVSFVPGQFLQVIFDEQNRINRNLNKFLSFSSAPGNGFIEVSKKLTGSDFSQRLKNLQPGQQVLFKAPMGNCVFHEEYSKILFLIGGIGITPVISILEYIMERRLLNEVALLYSNMTETEIAFKKELDEWSEKNSHLRIFYTVVAAPAQDPGIGFGMIDDKMVAAQVPDFMERHVYIFGPPAMVQAMQVICCNLGCRKEMTLIENFAGY